jgi:hypothetical protein
VIETGFLGNIMEVRRGLKGFQMHVWSFGFGKQIETSVKTGHTI